MNEALWALGRGTGVVALLLLTVSVVLGIVTRSGHPLLGLPRFSVTLVHRNASLLASVFLLIHIVSLFFDSYAQLRVVDFFVPFLGAAKPFWLGLGTVALDLLLAIIVTSLLRRWIGRRVFRVVHWFTYALWPVALAHSIGNGTDGTSVWFLALALASVVLVAVAVAWRVSANFIEFGNTRKGEAR
ncbi:ferric reductase-like transmembrane domain-containing protein [Lacisediminihabitans sp.]|uniref:ferric reductase-like transmembrane domain-containing protein n=1 Tax=Lacisediminihabitans sp. TaxID=2787631 RepID=UPI002F938F89